MLHAANGSNSLFSSRAGGVTARRCTISWCEGNKPPVCVVYPSDQPVQPAEPLVSARLRPVDPGPSDDVLIERARAGDDTAFRAIVERYESLVAATVISMLGPGAEADDVGQETFIRFYNHQDQFRGEASPGTYLTRIAINQSLKALRTRTRRDGRLLSRDDEDAFIDEPTTDGDDAVDVLE